MEDHIEAQGKAIPLNYQLETILRKKTSHGSRGIKADANDSGGRLGREGHRGRP